jgi:hypothetical protein
LERLIFEALGIIFEQPSRPLHHVINRYNAILFLTEHSEADAFLKTVTIKRKNLFHAFEKVCGGKYKGRINMSDLITFWTELNVDKNYAPDSDIDYVDPTGNDSKVNEDNPCTRWYYWGLARLMVVEAGEVWTEAQQTAVSKRVTITDYSKIIPSKKGTYKQELAEFSEDIGGMQVLDGLAAMEKATSAKFYRLRIRTGKSLLRTGKSLPVLRSSVFVDKRVFRNASPQSTEWMDLRPPAIHGQVLCIEGGLTLQSKERLIEIQKVREEAIGPVVNNAHAELGLDPIIPDASFIK